MRLGPHPQALSLGGIAPRLDKLRTTAARGPPLFLLLSSFLQRSVLDVDVADERHGSARSGGLAAGGGHGFEHFPEQTDLIHTLWEANHDLLAPERSDGLHAARAGATGDPFVQDQPLSGTRSGPRPARGAPLSSSARRRRPCIWRTCVPPASLLPSRVAIVQVERERRFAGVRRDRDDDPFRRIATGEDETVGRSGLAHRCRGARRTSPAPVPFSQPPAAPAWPMVRSTALHRCSAIRLDHDRSHDEWKRPRSTSEEVPHGWQYSNCHPCNSFREGRRRRALADPPGPIAVTTA